MKFARFSFPTLPIGVSINNNESCLDTSWRASVNDNANKAVSAALHEPSACVPYASRSLNE